MKKLFLLTILLHLTFIVKAQTSLSLDSCRALALTNNKDLLISHEKINAAHYQRKAAFTNYLPNFSATGAYMRNQKEFSLLNNDQKAALSGLGSNLAGPIGQAAAGIIATYPELAPLISSLSGSSGVLSPTWIVYFTTPYIEENFLLPAVLCINAVDGTRIDPLYE